MFYNRGQENTVQYSSVAVASQWKLEILYSTVSYANEAKMMTTNDHIRLCSTKVKELGWAVAVESMIEQST